MTISIQERFRNRTISVTVDPAAPSHYSVSVDLRDGLLQARRAINDLEPAGELVTFPAGDFACDNLDREGWAS